MSAIRVFQDLPHDRESRYLVTLLWIHKLLLPTLADPRVPRQLCLSLARTAAKIDPFFNNRLSGYIDESLFGRSGLPVDSATRLLGILIETAEPTGLGPLLRRILLHPNPRIRSKATVLIGRSPSGLRPIEQLLLDEDPRVRANAIEALWRHPDPRTSALFLSSLQDAGSPEMRFSGSTSRIDKVYSCCHWLGRPQQSDFSFHRGLGDEQVWRSPIRPPFRKAVGRIER